MLCIAKYFILARTSGDVRGERGWPEAVQGPARSGYPLDLPSLTDHYVVSIFTAHERPNQRVTDWGSGLSNLLNIVTRAVWSASIALALLAAPAASQAFPQLPPGWTSEDAIRMFQESPEFRELVRDQLQNSGLSTEEMRGLLAAAGYPPSLLDAFLADEASGPEDPRLLAAITALGVDPFAQIEVQAVPGDSVAVDFPDTLREVEPAGLPTFGMNIFQGDGSVFGAIEGGPVPGSYRLGPGDHLVLILTGAV